MDAPSLAAEIDAELRAKAVPGRAEKEKAYLKSLLEHYGTSMPAINAVAKGVRQRHPDLGHDELLALVQALWEEPVHERRAVAVELLDRYSDLLVASDMALLERLLRESRTWALVDGLAASVTGPLVERSREAADVLDHWAVDEDFWIRRSALLALLLALRRGEGDFERFGRYADAMLDEKEFFIRKAIGWVLRDTARKRPALVYDWFLPRAGRASGVTLREVLKPLSDRQRAAVLAARDSSSTSRASNAAVQITDVTLDTADGSMRLYSCVPEGGAARAVIVIQEAFGVNDHIEDVTRRFADAGYHAVAPALFHRAGGGTAPYDDFEKVLPLFEGLTDAGILMDVEAAVAHLHEQGFGDASIGIVGFCMGGRVTFLAALELALGAAVGFYGGGIVTGRFPQFPPLLERAGELKTPWLGLFGDLDASIPIEDVEALRTRLAGLDVPTDVLRYATAEHGFHCDARPSYDAEASTDAWGRTLAWFAEHLA